MDPGDKPLVWLHGEIETPPFSRTARIEAGYLLRLLQEGQAVGMPQSRPMPVVDADAVVILEVFTKKTRVTPKTVIDACTRGLREYDRA